MSTYNIVMLAGDGIGPEVMVEVEKIMDWIDENHSDISFSIDKRLVGGCSIDADGVPVTDATIAACKKADFVMLGAVGGPKWDNVAYNIRPEAGLLKIRKELDLFANLRPAIVFDALADASSLKKEIVSGLDILIVRELTGGIYFGEPRGIENMPDGQRRGYNTQVYTTNEIRRVTEVAFDLALKRSGNVCSCEKANVMESGKLWREEVTKLHSEGYNDIALTHMYADNCAMQLLRAPKQFDVIVTDNLFGDILSDEAAMLTGSLGMLPSASLGAEDAATGKRAAMYEPAHGSAPDIAGQGKANPLATILSFAMGLRYSLSRGDIADMIETSVKNVLARGKRTADIAAQDATDVLSTPQMGDEVMNELSALLKAQKAA